METSRRRGDQSSRQQFTDPATAYAPAVQMTAIAPGRLAAPGRAGRRLRGRRRRHRDRRHPRPGGVRQPVSRAARSTARRACGAPGAGSPAVSTPCSTATSGRRCRRTCSPRSPPWASSGCSSPGSATRGTARRRACPTVSPGSLMIAGPALLLAYGVLRNIPACPVRAPSLPDVPAIVWRRPLRPRDVHQAHRASTPLELLVDLAFVVGVAQVAASQHHALIERHFATAITAFPMVFFAIWWAWMNFTWFASAYDNDDVPYRIATLVQIAGVLVIAAGVPRAFDHKDFAVVTIGYGITRVGLISQWLRVDGRPVERTAARRYAAGLAIVQAGWFALLLPPGNVQDRRLRPPRRRRARRARAGRARREHVVASRAHRRALPAVHPDRARRVDARPDDRHPGRARQRQPDRRPRPDRRRRPAHRVLHVVAVLRPRRRGDAGAGHRRGRHHGAGQAPCVHLGLRPLLRLRRGGGGRRRAGRRRRAPRRRRPSTSRSSDLGAAFGLAVPIVGVPHVHVGPARQGRSMASTAGLGDPRCGASC